jgi:magnesium transporter
MPHPLRAFHIFGDQFVELEALPDALPPSGYLWIGTSRSAFEAAIGDIQAKLLAWTSSTSS